MRSREPVLQTASTLPECQIDGLSSSPRAFHHNGGIPNAVTAAALQEGGDMLRAGAGQGWTGSTEELFRKLLEEKQSLKIVLLRKQGER